MRPVLFDIQGFAVPAYGLTMLMLFLSGLLLLRHQVSPLGVNDGHMIDLDVWLDSANPVEGARWTLFYAKGISDTGRITGIGNYDDGPGGLDDGPRAFLLDASSLLVPEPCTLLLLALGGLAPLTRKQHRRNGAAVSPHLDGAV